MKRLILFIAVVVLAAVGWIARQSYAASATTQAQRLASMTNQAAMTTKLNDLKNYVTSHSGSTVTVILTADYNQAVAAAKEAAAAAPDSSVYSAAQAACAGRGVSSVTQAQCNQNYIQAHTPAATPVMQPKLSDYTLRLVAPIATLDLASICFALAFVALIFAVLPPRHPKTSYL